MKNILIIGGSYFAGRVFVEELLKTKDYNVFVYNRGNIPLGWKEVTELVGDREDEDQIRKTIPEKEWHALIDFCGYTPDHIEKMLRSLPGTLSHYIFISTTSIYENRFDLPIKEDAPKVLTLHPELGPYADYGMNKWLAECKLEKECKAKGITWTCLRPAIIYGKYNYAPRESYFFDLLRNNKPIIIPNNALALFSFTWVEDVAKIILRCLGNENVFNEAFNISGKELISYERWIELLEELSGKKLKTMRMSIAEMNENAIPLPFPPDSHLVYSGDKIQRILKFEYTPFVDGIRKTYEYYQMLQARKRATL
ncbi:NAD-dependent epimerase/dehydratase family protein [Desulfonema magnum]|uniref:UDP-glucose 4-epimerase n=1 Tax=Desulfonema magnum TaxID=45655 RepID=A0A975GTA1_9BACT|nr:NAD-dependent epimerase/dehydratase family protein [Desulfonema magnum]QTA92864.1 NADH dehydrogenase domain-containing protein [Desulfonema magnum]